VFFGFHSGNRSFGACFEPQAFFRLCLSALRRRRGGGPEPIFCPSASLLIDQTVNIRSCRPPCRELFSRTRPLRVFLLFLVFFFIRDPEFRGAYPALFGAAPRLAPPHLPSGLRRPQRRSIKARGISTLCVVNPLLFFLFRTVVSYWPVYFPFVYVRD